MSLPKVPQKKTQQQNCYSLNSCNTYTSEDGHATTATITNSTYNPLLQQQHDTCETQFTNRQHIYNQHLHKTFVIKLLCNKKLSVCVKSKGWIWLSQLLSNRYVQVIFKIYQHILNTNFDFPLTKSLFVLDVGNIWCNPLSSSWSANSPPPIPNPFPNPAG